MVRDLLPREHGVWAWLGVPLAGALVQAPTPGTVAAVVAAFLGFGAVNALGRRAWPAAALAACAGAPAALAALWTAPGPQTLAVGFGACALAGLGAASSGRFQRHPVVEVGGMALLCGLGATIAIGGGGEPAVAWSAAALQLSWFVLGLWWINGLMARVLPGRAPWRHGLAVALVLAAGSAALAVWLGRPFVALLPALYALRARVHAPPASARDARRVGLTELAWSLFVGLAATL